jgi:hypothetical protein
MWMFGKGEQTFECGDKFVRAVMCQYDDENVPGKRFVFHVVDVLSRRPSRRASLVPMTQKRALQFSLSFLKRQ